MCWKMQLEMFTNIGEIIEFKIEVSLICPAGSPKSTLFFFILLHTLMQKIHKDKFTQGPNTIIIHLAQ